MAKSQEIIAVDNFTTERDEECEYFYHTIKNNDENQRKELL